MKGHRSGPPTSRLRPSLGTGAVIVALAALVAAAWRYPLVVAAACALAGILFMHELGHYVAARSVGMKVTEFYLGFGPEAVDRETRRDRPTDCGFCRWAPTCASSGCQVQIGWIPATKDRSYRVKSYPRRMLVVSAGSLMHFALAIVAFLALHAWIGAPDYDGGRWQVAEDHRVTRRRRAAGPWLPASAVGDRIVARRRRSPRSTGMTLWPRCSHILARALCSRLNAMAPSWSRE